LACEGRSLGLSAADLQLVENDARYPAGFQCFPVPGVDVLYDVSTGTAVSIDVYGLAADKEYELMRGNALAAVASWSQLNIDGHPKQISYIVIAGQGVDTSKAYLFDGTQYVQTITEDGDGVVPLWSALAGKNVTHYTVIGDHVGILGTPELKQTLDTIFGLPPMSAFLKGETGVTVLVNKHTFRPGEMMQVVVVPDTPTHEIDGKLTLAFAATFRSHDKSSELMPYGTGSSLTYKGPETSHLSSRLTAPRVAGAYVLKFEGTHRSSSTSSAVFFVNAASTVSIHSNKPERPKRHPADRKSKVSKAKRKK
jgi:hypothetical protein